MVGLDSHAILYIHVSWTINNLDLTLDHKSQQYTTQWRPRSKDTDFQTANLWQLAYSLRCSSECLDVRTSIRMFHAYYKHPLLHVKLSIFYRLQYELYISLVASCLLVLPNNMWFPLAASSFLKIKRDHSKLERAPWSPPFTHALKLNIYSSPKSMSSITHV